MNLTNEQQGVVDSKNRVTLVKACPGSGKTHTVVHRANSMDLASTKLLLAFNKEAANVLQSRLEGLDTKNAKAQTFHSFALGYNYSRAKSMGYTSKPTLLLEPSYTKALRDELKRNFRTWDDERVDYDSFRDFDRSCYDSEVERELATPIDLSWPDEDLIRWKTFEAVRAWRRWLVRNNLVTFDSCIRLLAQNRYLLYNHNRHHVYIDEFQDLDRFQFEIVQAMANEGSSLESMTVIGDPNQRIYEWRGALSNGFQKLQAVQPKAQAFPLSTNFRSHDGIIAHAESVFKVNMKGIRGERDPRSVELIEGRLGQFSKALDLLCQPTFLPEESAVLCRYNKDVYQVALKLVQRRVPVFIMRSAGEKDFWDLPHIRLATQFKVRHFGCSEEDLLSSDEWHKFISAPRYQDSDQLRTEVTNDAIWIINLPDGEMELMKGFIQNPRGVCISTVHKTKGKEWPQVLVYDELGMASEPNVRYVAVTRAKDRLILT